MAIEFVGLLMSDRIFLDWVFSSYYLGFVRLLGLSVITDACFPDNLHPARVEDILEEGDIEEAMQCAQAIGDDRIQEQAQGHVRPDLFTHGTSEQRARWFNKGFRTGDIDQGDTFSIPYGQL